MNRQSEPGNPQPQPHNAQPELRNPHSAIRNPEPGNGAGGYSFCSTGRDYAVVFGGAPAFYLPPFLGSHYLDFHLHQPWLGVSSFELEVIARPEKGQARARNSIQKGSDAQACQSYRQELQRLQAASNQARAAGQSAEVARLRSQMRLYQLALRESGIDNDTLERARSNVWHAIHTSRRLLPRLEELTTRQPNGVWEQRLVQGENPAQPSRQEQSYVRVRTYALPGQVPSFNGQAPEKRAETPSSNIRAPEKLQGANTKLPALKGGGWNLEIPPSQLLMSEREETHTRTELGAAQKDTANELGARLSSLKGIVWVGVLLFIFGLASLAWPPLKVVIGSVTTSAALAAGGLALIILPSLVVGHELLLLGSVGTAVGGWFLAHRHGHMSASSKLQTPSST